MGTCNPILSQEGVFREEELLPVLRLRLLRLPERPERARLGQDDGRGALGVFLLVFLSTFPVVIPFIVMRDP